MKAVLVVDDNTAVRMVLTDILTMAYPTARVLQAENGADGLALAQAEQPDLVLMDAEMPVLDGFAAAKKMRQAHETKSIPIIAISSGASNNELVTGLRSLADSSLPKPFTADDLFQTVSRVMSRRTMVLSH
ncbi:MAG: response regulator [Ardenticatenaceae bacterium]|nr:response regulator [Anaerolineales bacterium]MCB8940312.1 response regulator [Ardenticatenaceae bacterium]MCB8973328.1 response regulator [Ardenticatenaceae bacterium]